MSSDELEKHAWTPRAPSERILMALKMHGALTSAQMGRRLEITGEAARQQLVKLAEDGLVRDERRSAGRGRPSTYWHLTEKGQARFPDSHAALTVELLRSIREVLGEEALDRIISAREAGTQALYRAALADGGSLRDRVTRLAKLRSEEGYMATAEEAGDGSMMLIENHCPICAAATICQGFCRSEKAVFESVLGEGTTVERVEHIVKGGRRCTYRITEARP
ncbi:helix-turn-helix transcriptional regulator [Salipiger abyssi]|uniref:Putative transcriptional regulator n=1 Tax=Salipiger abyssi TaxID=1250539 RepID=A0A1P8V0Y5_9RHOB|nr:metalloregulator ArsR/SmtB family transcription factor [Salipiger abyssi]APZ55313.1 putative transcriptional regulator [Salipiger abyssi]